MRSNHRIRVAIADDHPVVLCGLKHVLTNFGFDVVSVVDSASDLGAALKGSRPDVLILDYQFGVEDAPDGLRLLRLALGSFPFLRVIVYSSITDVALVDVILNAGATGFVSKGGDSADLWSAVFCVMRGTVYVDPATSKRLLAYRDMPDEVEGRSLRLSVCEEEVVRLLSRGLSVSEVASALARSVKTVSSHKRSAMQKLGATSDFSLVRAYLERSRWNDEYGNEAHADL